MAAKGNRKPGALATDLDSYGGTAGQALVADGSRGSSWGDAGIPSGPSFPGSPSDDDQFNHTTKKAQFRYDATRAKWLTESRAFFELGKASVVAAANVYFLVGDAAGNASTGLRMVRDGTIVSTTIDNDSTVTRNVEVRVEDSAVNKVVLALSTAKAVSKADANVDFVAGNSLQVVALTALGNSLSNAQVTIEVAWR